MKTVEEKAQAYDEAIERARKLKENPQSVFNEYSPKEGDTICDYIFPELKELGDEKIRKALVELVKCNERSGYTLLNNVSTSSMLAWLEKQGEQKPFDYENANIQQNDFAPKVEPKFKVGNWYQCTKDFFGKGVTFDKNTAYYCAKEGCLQCEYGCYIAIVKNLYDNFKLWTIQDAEDGDVLAFDNNTIVIFKDLYNATTFHSYCHIEDGLFGVSKDEMPDWWEGKGFHPATKEQRDLLFAKMKESGYEWLEETKELKKIEQKSAWSEEDEKIRQTIINEFKQCSEWYCSNGLTKEDCINWLNKQEYFEWGDEDNENMNSLCVLLDQMVSINAIGNEHSIEYKNWLKSIKQRMGG